ACDQCILNTYREVFTTFREQAATLFLSELDKHLLAGFFERWNVGWHAVLEYEDSRALAGTHNIGKIVFCAQTKSGHEMLIRNTRCPWRAVSIVRCKVILGAFELRNQSIKLRPIARNFLSV